MHDFASPIRFALPGALLTVLALGLMTNPASAHAENHPADRWELALEAGYLEKVKENSPLDYVIVPAQAA